MPRFALLRHDSPRGLHWDFFLEFGETLRTWELAEPPRDGVEIVCQPLDDHRLEYLTYEGPVSKDRGHVVRWDGGEFTLRSCDESRCEVSIRGRWLAGNATIRQTAEGWRFVFTADRKTLSA